MRKKIAIFVTAALFLTMAVFAQTNDEPEGISFYKTLQLYLKFWGGKFHDDYLDAVFKHVSETKKEYAEKKQNAAQFKAFFNERKKEFEEGSRASDLDKLFYLLNMPARLLEYDETDGGFWIFFEGRGRHPFFNITADNKLNWEGDYYDQSIPIIRLPLQLMPNGYFFKMDKATSETLLRILGSSRDVFIRLFYKIDKNKPKYYQDWAKKYPDDAVLPLSIVGGYVYIPSQEEPVGAISNIKEFR